VPNITLLEGLDGYSKHELLEQFKVSINISSSPVSEIQIVTENSSISDNDYKDLVKFLSGELGVKVEAYEDFQAPYLPWLSIKPGDLKMPQL
jgi:hypothetical protein